MAANAVVAALLVYQPEVAPPTPETLLHRYFRIDLLSRSAMPLAKSCYYTFRKKFVDVSSNFRNSPENKF